MPRIAGIDVPDKKKILFALQYIHGIGPKVAADILTEAKVDPNTRANVVEEAQLFTKRRVGPEAKEAGSRAENALDRIIREGRKYGICVVVASQSIRDFSHDVASIRQKTTAARFAIKRSPWLALPHRYLCRPTNRAKMVDAGIR